MKNEEVIDPTLPAIPKRALADLTDEINQMREVGRMAEGITARTERRKTEILARQIPTEKLSQADARRAKLEQQMRELDAETEAELNIVAGYKRLIEARDGKIARLRRADDKMGLFGSADDQRAFIAQHLGDLQSDVNDRGDFWQMFANIGIANIIVTEWPKIRAGFEADVEKARQAVFDYKAKHKIADEVTPASPAPSDPSEFAPKRYDWKN